MRASNAPADSRPASMRDQHVAHVRRAALVVEERTRLPAERAAGDGGRKDLDHQCERAALGAADRQQRAAERGLRVGGRAARPRRRPSPRESACPAFSAATILPRAATDSARSIDQRRAPPGSGAAKARGLVPSIGLAAAPERHGLGRVAEHQRDQPAFRESFGMGAGLAEMVRAVDRGDGDALLACQRRQRLDRQRRSPGRRSRSRRRRAVPRPRPALDARRWRGRRPCRPAPAARTRARATGRARPGRRLPRRRARAPSAGAFSGLVRLGDQRLRRRAPRPRRGSVEPARP